MGRDDAIIGVGGGDEGGGVVGVWFEVVVGADAVEAEEFILVLG